MADLYLATIYKTSNIPAEDIAQNVADRTDFENNYKATAISVQTVPVQQNSFIVTKTYTNFKALIDGVSATWSIVRYIETNESYSLYLVSNAFSNNDLASATLIVGLDRLFPPESYPTTNVLLNARPVNGDFNVHKLKSKTVLVENTGGLNNATINVQGKITGLNALGNPVTCLVTLISGQVLTPGQAIEATEDTVYEYLIVLAKSSVVGLSTTVRTIAYGGGT